MDLLAIPGYAEALIRERVVRDAAFLGITESVGPFEVVPMTLRHWMLLRTMGNPVVRQGEGAPLPAPEQLRDFLWVVNPRFNPSALETKQQRWAKMAFRRRCRKVFYPPRYLALWDTAKARARHERRCKRKLEVAAAIIDAAKAYVAETMQDRPPQQATIRFDPDYYSDAAFFCARFGREYGWSQEETLNTPLKRIWQYLNEMKRYHDSKTPLCNPSDSVRAKWMREVNQQRKGLQ
jgi:hypothetical protein